MYFTKPLFYLLSLAGSALTAATPVRSNLESRVSPRSTELIQSGLSFNIYNVKSGTVMDLSAADNKSSKLPRLSTFSFEFTVDPYSYLVIGYPLDQVGGNNQKWTTLWNGGGWYFQNVQTGTYLGIAGTPDDGQNLTVSTTPTNWDIWHDSVNETNYRCVTLLPILSFTD